MVDKFLQDEEFIKTESIKQSGDEVLEIKNRSADQIRKLRELRDETEQSIQVKSGDTIESLLGGL